MVIMRDVAFRFEEILFYLLDSLGLFHKINLVLRLHLTNLLLFLLDLLHVVNLKIVIDLCSDFINLLLN